MIPKYLIAIFLIVSAVHGATVTVSDSADFQVTEFGSIFKLSGVQKDQLITVSYQYGNQTTYAFDAYLFLVSATALPASGTANVISFGAKNTDSKSFSPITAGGTTATTVAGDYYLYLKWPAGPRLGGFGSNVYVLSLTVTGSAVSRTAPILKQTAAIGPFRFHRVYFANPTEISIAVTYTDNIQKGYLNKAGYVKVQQQVSGQAYAMDNTVINPIVPSGSTAPIDNTTTKTLTWTYPLPTGYSWIIVDIGATTVDAYPVGTAGTNTWANPGYPYSHRMSWTTEVYACPYIIEYSDNTGVFKGCQFAQDNSKLPCIVFDKTTQTCTACYTGYTVINGKCVESTCPAGQYKKYGACLDNPAGCATYSDFAGCTQCATNFTLENGVCSKTPLNCAGRTWYNAVTYTCDPVNDKCREWTLGDGKCTSCLSPAEKAVNGVCVEAVSTCTDKQYLDATGTCVDADPLCQFFEKVGGKCTKCVWAYEWSVKESKCVKIVCQNRYVPNDYGKCAKVSDLCDTFDAHGVCLTCIPTHTLRNGVCLQIETPLPCPDRQYLGQDNICHEVSQYCAIYNKDDGKCSECINGFVLMYTGECVLKKTCKSRQVLINNDCHDVSPTCGNYDRTTGKCLNCASDKYELYYGLCIPKTRCGVRQWTDNDGQCHEVNARCNTYNPSTGECTSCVQGYSFLNGICCIQGQFNQNGECVDATDATQIVNDNGCARFMYGIGCLVCNNGFQRAQDQYGFFFCQAI